MGINEWMSWWKGFCYRPLSFVVSLLQAFDQTELLECIRRLVEIDQDWVPRSDSASLYIRPTFISTEVRRMVTFLWGRMFSKTESHFNFLNVFMAAFSGRKAAWPCLAVCDLVSSWLLFQLWGRCHLPVGWPKIHTGLERRNWRLQDGRVGRCILYESLLKFPKNQPLHSDIRLSLIW